MRAGTTAEDRTLPTKSPSERRKSKRYKVAIPTFVECSLDALATGQILDISKGGLSFRYMSKGDKPEKIFQLRIYSSRDNFSIENITVKTVYDHIMPVAFTVTKATMRRRGVQFTDLSPSQHSQLEHFIQNYAQDEEPD
jgi:c-di-GMP-binding flagellar brake protein YcgR